LRCGHPRGALSGRTMREDGESAATHRDAYRRAAAESIGTLTPSLERNFNNLVGEESWNFNRRTRRLAASQEGEVNGSEFWSASTYQQQLSPALVAAASRDLDHGRLNRGGHAFTSLVNFSPPARSGERRDRRPSPMRHAQQGCRRACYHRSRRRGR
jgi:hypothetical protein